MRAKQSFTASGMYSSPGILTEFPIKALIPRVPPGMMPASRVPIPGSYLVRPSAMQPSAARPSARIAAPCPGGSESEGLLHDARNLMGALGLYCDLLSIPGVLKPEHLHYAEEVRLLSTRSSAMIQRLMENGVQGPDGPAGAQGSDPGGPVQMARAVSSNDLEPKVKPVSLRSIVERSSGLLRQVACGRAIEICYGAAALVPVRVAEEAVERILVNLVRNAAAALAEREAATSPLLGLGEIRPGDAGSGLALFAGPDGQDWLGETPGRTDSKEPSREGAAIRIGVGTLVNRGGDPQLWPFRRVRLTVEDAGCGMASEQLDRLVCGGREPSRGSHGIGFHVVRELVSASDGNLRAMSAPGVGTRVQIEWPMAGTASQNVAEAPNGFAAGGERGRSC